MTYEEFFSGLANCDPDSRDHPLTVIDVRTLPKAIYTVPEIVAENAIKHLANREIEKSRKEPYSCSISYLCPGHAIFCAHDVAPGLFFDVFVLYSSSWGEVILFGETVEEKPQRFWKKVECWERHNVSVKKHLTNFLLFPENNQTFWLTLMLIENDRKETFKFM